MTAGARPGADARRIDLNADVGETPEPGPGGDPAGSDAAARLLALVTTAHVACGFHAGGPTVMRRTVAAAVANGVAVGAHPSYDDPEGFGRRPVDRSAGLVADDVARQLDALGTVTRESGTAIRSVKPHGALYHRIASDEDCAVAVADVVREWGAEVVLVLPARAPARAAVEARGVAVVAEAFCDRAYLPDGSLAPRSAPGSLVLDPAEVARRAVSLATGEGVRAVDGSRLALDCDTLCIHGDTPGAPSLGAAVRRALSAAGVALAPCAGPVPG
ncbi:MAG: 5-oxoprolinase subunit PxpA [Acidimicrobiales bacterium]